MIGAFHAIVNQQMIIFFGKGICSQLKCMQITLPVSASLCEVIKIYEDNSEPKKHNEEIAKSRPNILLSYKLTFQATCRLMTRLRRDSESGTLPKIPLLLYVFVNSESSLQRLSLIAGFSSSSWYPVNILLWVHRQVCIFVNGGHTPYIVRLF